MHRWQYVYLLLLGTLFGVLLGVGINDDLRSNVIIALSLFLIAICVYYLIAKRRE